MFISELTCIGIAQNIYNIHNIGFYDPVSVDR